MNRQRATVVVIALVMIAAAVVRVATDRSSPRVLNFRDSGVATVFGASVVQWSPDTSQLASVRDGVLSVVGVRRGNNVVRAGSHIVAAAWMPDGARVLVAEGPTPTGQVAVIGLNGKVQGVTRLSPSIGFGDGLGLAVNSNGTQAAAISVTRDTIGGAAHSDVALINLQSGVVRVLATPGVEESYPVYVNDETIAVATGGKLTILNTITEVTTTQRGDIFDGPFASTPDGEVIVGVESATPGATDIVAVSAATGVRRALSTLSVGHRAVAVDGKITRVVTFVESDDASARARIEPLN